MKIINVLEMFEVSAERNIHNIVFEDDKEAYEYGEALEYAKRIGSFLAHKDSKKGAVCVYMPKTAMQLVVFMGVIYSGNYYVPIDPEMPFERQKKIYDTVNPIAIITAGKTSKNDLGEFETVKYDVSNTLEFEIDLRILSEIRDKAIDTDPIYILFTSGSTGMPKGAIISHRSVIDYAGWVCDTFNITNKTIFGSQTPFYFSMSVLDIYATICAGARLVVIPKVFFTFPADLVEYLNQKEINTVYWVPSALCMLTKSGILQAVKIDKLKTILFAGESMPTKHFNILKNAIPDALYANLFGPTEITDIGAYYIVDREISDDQIIPIGMHCRNVNTFIIDDDGNEIIQEDVLGELYFRGNYLGMGYYDDPQKTAEMFVQNPLNSHYPEIVYKTGDLVKYNSLGEMVYVGRKDSQIKHMGNRIELGEIENAILQVEDLQTCVCLHFTEDDTLVLFYEATKEMDSEIQEFAKEKLPKYMIPTEYYRLNRFPINKNGKIDRLELRKMRK